MFTDCRSHPMPAPSGHAPIHALRARRDGISLRAAVRATLEALPTLPLPGRGDTLQRWRALHSVAQIDLVLAKLLEPHWDTQAILADLDVPIDVQAGDLWAVWAAEAPHARVRGVLDAKGKVVLNGRKAWCSGAAIASHALITYQDEQDRAALAAVALDAEGISVTDEGWQAVGMDATASVEIILSNVTATPVGTPGAYLDRPGFWQGGMGIAACWLGGASALALAARTHARERTDPLAWAHVGALDVALTPAYALMRQTAAWLDSHPRADAKWAAFRLRAAVEACAQTVLHHSGRVLGAGPLCRDARLARLYADLPVFLRQSHGERDLAALGQAVAQHESTGEEESAAESRRIWDGSWAL